MNKYNLRFNYYREKSGNSTYYRREIKSWWKPFYALGEYIQSLNYKTVDSNRLSWFIRNHLTYS